MCEFVLEMRLLPRAPCGYQGAPPPGPPPCRGPSAALGFSRCAL